MASYYALQDSNFSRGKWRTTYTVRDSDADDVVISVHQSMTSAVAEAKARNGVSQPVEVRP